MRPTGRASKTKVDMVRHELLTAVAQSNQGLTIVLTFGRKGRGCRRRPPSPAELHALLEWNAYPLSEEGWEDDVRRLVRQSPVWRPDRCRQQTSIY